VGNPRSDPFDDLRTLRSDQGLHGVVPGEGELVFATHDYVDVELRNPDVENGPRDGYGLGRE